MNIVRRNDYPANRPGMLDEQFGRLFEDMVENFFSPFTPYSSLLARRDGGNVVSPRLNVVETDKSYDVEAELPGVTKDDIKVAIDGRRVIIEGEAKRETEQKEGENIIYAERSTRRFARSFTLPTEVDDAGAQAKLENGILMLSLPKKESSQAKRLTIQ
jgi:HSP20 family protein